MRKRGAHRGAISSVLCLAASGLLIAVILFESFPLSWLRGVMIMGAVGSSLVAPTLERHIRDISFEGISKDKGIERRIRILFALAVQRKLRFRDIQELTGYSGGALSPDLAWLEKNGLISAERAFLDNGMRMTTYMLTDKGKEKLKQYLDTFASCLKLFEKSLQDAK